MELLWSMTAATENKLSMLGFVQTSGHDEGMRKSYAWTNQTMTIGLYYDRGYFDCFITSIKEPKTSAALINLLKYIHNDLGFYDKELKQANLWNTLSTEGYFELFFEYYERINDFYHSDNVNDLKHFFDKANTP